VITDLPKLSSTLLLAAIFAIACRDEQPAAPAEAAPAEAEQDAAAKTGAPKIASDEPVFDFGAVAGKEKIEHVFKIKNVGDAELKIDRVQKT
jgi:hypothetical protein